MPFIRELQELQSIHPAYPFLSVYLDVGHSEESAESMRVFVKTRLRQAHTDAPTTRDRSLLETDGRHVMAYLEDVIHARVERKSQGLAVFACARQKLFQVVSSPEPFGSTFIVSDRPYLEPLRTRGGASPRVIACLVDSRSARIVELGADGVHPQAEIQNDIGRRHHQGGWSQMRFQRHADDRIDHHYREVAAVLTHLSDRDPQIPVVIAGPEPVVAAVRAHLPERVQPRIVAGLPMSLKLHEREIVERILETYSRGEEERQERELARQIEDALSPTRGARGTEEVLQAANEHAIRRLFLDSEYEARGWRCTSCGALGSHVPLMCPFCAGTVEGTDLRPALIAKVVGNGGEVAGLPQGLDLRVGALALLRHPL